MRESYPPTLLGRKTERLRKETGNSALRSKLDSGLKPAELFKLSIVRPAKLLIFSPIVLALSTFMAVVYGYLYLLFTTITNVFETRYHFSQGSVGLTYLGIGLGSFVGVFLFGIASDRIVKAKSAAGVMKPEYRLPPMIPGSFAIPIGRMYSRLFYTCAALTSSGSVFVWMVCRKGSSLDCSYHWDRSSRSGASGNLRKCLHDLFVGVFNISTRLDAHLNLPG